jgi:tRNA (5-methylaminomethyl-2-thiouridylate)-methyltransferase
MRIVVAMSGGVDSSVAAALLAEQGHDVIGLSMQLYDQSEGHTAFGSCCSLDDLYDARKVAAAIRIPHYILNFERQFNEQVVSNFVGEYAAGRTPLPCAHCNSDLKFATLVDRAAGFGADAVATGHYARVEYAAPRLASEHTVRSGQGRYLLKRAVDPAKDQSYFLFSLTQDQLAHAVFPVGDRPKESVRAYARTRQLPVADKADSQEICFIPDHDYARFVASHAPEVTHDGPIVDEAGRLLGRHDGIHHSSASEGTPGLARRGPTVGRRCTCSTSAPTTARSSSDPRRRSNGPRSRRHRSIGSSSHPQVPSARQRRFVIAIRRRRRQSTRSVPRAQRSSSTRRNSRSRPDKRSSSTMGMSCSAEAGSTDADRSAANDLR